MIDPGKLYFKNGIVRVVFIIKTNRAEKVIYFYNLFYVNRLF